MEDQIITCPNCGTKFPASKILTAQIEDKLLQEFEKKSKENAIALKKDYEAKLVTEMENISKKAKQDAEQASNEKVIELNKKLASIEAKSKEEKENYLQLLKEEKEKAKQAAEKEIRTQLSKQTDELIKKIEKQKELLDEAKKTEKSLQEREEALKNQQADLKTKIQKEVAIARKKAIQEATEKVDAEYENRELIHQKAVSDLRKKLKEAQRQIEQGSQQAQGEVVELALEKILTKAFPEDKIKPVAKGKHGADIIQKIFSSDKKCCGTIVWESKNTKSWKKEWLTKLRSDQRREKAEIAVIVSTTLPKGLTTKFGQIGGVWISDFTSVTGLAAALRYNLIELASVKLSNKGRTEKMELVYNYLMSTEFKQRVEAIAEAFWTMKEDLDKERRLIEQSWAKRETQLNMVIQNIGGMVSDLQGIAPALPKIKRLELT